MIADKIYMSLLMIGKAAVLLFMGLPRSAYYCLRIGFKLINLKDTKFVFHKSTVGLAFYGSLILIILIMAIIITLTLLIQ